MKSYVGIKKVFFGCLVGIFLFCLANLSAADLQDDLAVLSGNLGSLKGKLGDLKFSLETLAWELGGRAGDQPKPALPPRPGGVSPAVGAGGDASKRAGPLTLTDEEFTKITSNQTIKDFLLADKAAQIEGVLRLNPIPVEVTNNLFDIIRDNNSLTRIDQSKRKDVWNRALDLARTFEACRIVRNLTTKEYEAASFKPSKKARAGMRDFKISIIQEVFSLLMNDNDRLRTFKEKILKKIQWDNDAKKKSAKSTLFTQILPQLGADSAEEDDKNTFQDRSEPLKSEIERSKAKLQVEVDSFVDFLAGDKKGGVSSGVGAGGSSVGKGSSSVGGSSSSSAVPSGPITTIEDAIGLIDSELVKALAPGAGRKLYESIQKLLAQTFSDDDVVKEILTKDLDPNLVNILKNNNPAVIIYDSNKDCLAKRLLDKGVLDNIVAAIMERAFFIVKVVDAKAIYKRLLTEPKWQVDQIITIVNLKKEAVARNPQDYLHVIELAFTMLFNELNKPESLDKKIERIVKLDVKKLLDDNAAGGKKSNLQLFADDIIEKIVKDCGLNYDSSVRTDLKAQTENILTNFKAQLNLNKIDEQKKAAEYLIDELVKKLKPASAPVGVVPSIPGGGAPVPPPGGGAPIAPPPPPGGGAPVPPLGGGAQKKDKQKLQKDDIRKLIENIGVLSGSQGTQDGLFTAEQKNNIKDAVVAALKDKSLIEDLKKIKDFKEDDILKLGKCFDPDFKGSSGVGSAAPAGGKKLNTPKLAPVKIPDGWSSEQWEQVKGGGTLGAGMVTAKIKGRASFIRQEIEDWIGKIKGDSSYVIDESQIPDIKYFIQYINLPVDDDVINGLNLYNDAWKDVVRLIESPGNEKIKDFISSQISDWDAKKQKILDAKEPPRKSAFGGGGSSAAPVGGAGGKPSKKSSASGAVEDLIDSLELNRDHYDALWKDRDFQQELKVVKLVIERMCNAGFGGSQYHPLIDDALHKIAKAYFEKYVLAQCKWYLNLKDKDRSQSAHNFKWVQENFFQHIHEAITTNTKFDVDGTDAATRFKERVFDRTVNRTQAALLNMFSEPGKLGQLVNCGCLPGRTLGNASLNSDAEIMSNELRLPLLYLIYETMHITLHHDFFLIDPDGSSVLMGPLMKIFDLRKKLRTEDKIRFHIGFDKVFEKVINLVVNDEESLKKKLIPRPKSYDHNYHYCSNAKPPYDLSKVITDTQEDDEGNIIQKDGKDEQIVEMVFPGEVRMNDQMYRDAKTEDEKNNVLRFAVKTYLKYHSPYSVGLVPRDFCEMFDVGGEIHAQIQELIAEHTRNDTEKKELTKKADGLRRIKPIIDAFVQYQIPSLIPQAIYSSLSAALRGIVTGFGDLNSVTEEEWLAVFSSIEKMADQTTWEKVLTIFSNDEFVDIFRRQYTDDWIVDKSKKLSDIIINNFLQVLVRNYREFVSEKLIHTESLRHKLTEASKRREEAVKAGTQADPNDEADAIVLKEIEDRDEGAWNEILSEQDTFQKMVTIFSHDGTMQQFQKTLDDVVNSIVKKDDGSLAVLKNDPRMIISDYFVKNVNNFLASKKGFSFDAAIDDDAWKEILFIFDNCYQVKGVNPATINQLDEIFAQWFQQAFTSVCEKLPKKEQGVGFKRTLVAKDIQTEVKAADWEEVFKVLSEEERKKWHLIISHPKFTEIINKHIVSESVLKTMLSGLEPLVKIKKSKK